MNNPRFNKGDLVSAKLWEDNAVYIPGVAEVIDIYPTREGTDFIYVCKHNDITYYCRANQIYLYEPY